MSIFKKRKFYIPLIIILFIVASLFFVQKIKNYLYFEHVAEASNSLPYQFGGHVTYYQPMCASDPITGICANCPMCSSPAFGVGNFVCNAYQEVEFTPAGGSTPPNFICVPKGSLFIGGVPTPGGQIIGGGSSNIFVWIAAVSH